MINPTREYVLIEPDKAEEKTSLGVYLPEKAQDKPMKGTVIEVGDYNHDSPVKKNDKVYYKKWGGNDINHEGKDYVIVKFEDILGVIK